MKKAILTIFLLLTCVVVSNARQTSYEEFLSTLIGQLYTKDTFQVDKISLESDKGLINKVHFGIVTYTIENKKYAYLIISRDGSLDPSQSTAILSIENAKGLHSAINKMKLLNENPEPKDAEREITYISPDLISVQKDKKTWKISLRDMFNYSLHIANIDIFNNKLEEIIKLAEQISTNS